MLVAAAWSELSSSSSDPSRESVSSRWRALEVGDGKPAGGTFGAVAKERDSAGMDPIEAGLGTMCLAGLGETRADSALVKLSRMLSIATSLSRLIRAKGSMEVDGRGFGGWT